MAKCPTCGGLTLTEHPHDHAQSLTVTIPGRPPNVGNARMSWKAKHFGVARVRKELVALLTSSARAKAQMAPASTGGRIRHR